MHEIFIRIKGGGSICVPQSPVHLTTYVLLEQEDWFEKEIGFVRRFLQPGMRAIDVGANYGVYTLAIARAIGSTGALYAFEPASATADHLRRTINRNQLRNVTLRQCALSDRVGTARLRVEPNAELNAISAEARGSSEEVRLFTLDHEAEALNWGAIDFVKLDAEGEEVNIVTGGDRFFREQSPLVMFELKHGATVNHALPSAFEEHGFQLYRLIGPDSLLVPFDRDGIDGFELNLFACKLDRAALLAAERLLVTTPEAVGQVPAGLGRALWRGQAFAAAFDDPAAPMDPLYETALDCYALWRDTSIAPAQRYAALTASLMTLQACAAGTDDLAALSTVARVAMETGARDVAVKMLRRAQTLDWRHHPPIRGPFWPAAPRYDAIAADAEPQAWFAAALVEALETQRAFSSYFASTDGLTPLDWLQSTIFASAAMERRRQLLSLRAGRQRSLVATPVLAQRTPDHLNPNLWGSPTPRKR